MGRLEVPNPTSEALPLLHSPSQSQQMKSLSNEIHPSYCLELCTAGSANTGLKINNNQNYGMAYVQGTASRK